MHATPGTLLIYPLVLDDKLWLVWGAASGKRNVVFQSKQVPVSRNQLAQTVRQFRELLATPSNNLSRLQAVGKTLHGWLIGPIEPTLAGQEITNLVFSPDRVTRYIPMAALHDGQRYLIERFTLSTILTAELTDTTDRLAADPQANAVLAMGVSEAPGYGPCPMCPLKSMRWPNRPAAMPWRLPRHRTGSTRPSPATP